MKKKICTSRNSLMAVLLLLLPVVCHSQTVNELLEKARLIRENDYLFLDISEGKLRYDIRSNPQRFHWKETQKDQDILCLARSSVVTVLMIPFNPLQWNYNATQYYTTNTIDSARAAAFGNITDFLTKYGQPAAGLRGALTEYEKLIQIVRDLEDLLKADQVGAIASTFRALSSLSFGDQASTVRSVQDITLNQLDQILKHFEAIDTMLARLKKGVDQYSGSDSGDQEPDAFMVQYIFGRILLDCKNIRDDQFLRVTNLNKCFALVNAQITKATNSISRIPWMLDLPNLTFTKGKITNLKVTGTSSGYTVAENNEIVSRTQVEQFTEVFNIRPFQRFIPSVSAGVAYANLHFPKFGTSKNDNGEDVVADAGEDLIRKTNFTTMINWNYYTKNSTVNPFFQLGIGANVGYPTLLLGIGGRFHSLGNIPTLSLSFGAASTWVKTLSKLKIGDKVSGTAEIDQDTKYEFGWPLKLYLAFQIEL